MKEMLKEKGLGESTKSPVTTKSFLCQSCCPHLPLMGQRAFKLDETGNAWFGMVLEIAENRVTRGNNTVARQLSQGCLQYVVVWKDERGNQEHVTQEDQRTLQASILLSQTLAKKFKSDAATVLKKRQVQNCLLSSDHILRFCAIYTIDS